MPRRVRSLPAGDFASAAMVRVLVQGMRDLGLAPTVTPPAEQAHVGLDHKRALLQGAVAQGGLACLALLGRGIRRFAHEPLHLALASARDPGDLFRRWSRLEAYLHSRHRVDLLELQAGSAQLLHRSLETGAPPLPAESLVVLGLVAALLEEVGLQQVTCEAGGAAVYPQPQPRLLAGAARSGATDRWHIRWLDPSGGAGAVPRSNATELPDLIAAEPWPDVGRKVFQALVAALPVPPDLADLARQLAISPRQLQRQLQQAGLRYAGLLAEARYRCAGWWLLQTTLPLAEVGFLSGHADQPHLTRSFRRRSGMTPQAFRQAFGAGVCTVAATAQVQNACREQDFQTP